MVPSWKKDLDALVTETMAFAASVKEQQAVQPRQVDPPVADATASEGEANEETGQSDLSVMATVEAVLAQEPTAPSPLPEAPSPLPVPATWPARLPPLTVPPSERAEIKERLTNFKAHQLRMQAEREDFYLQTMTRTRAVAAGSLPVKDK